MLYFGCKSQNTDQLSYALGNEITVRGGYSANTPVIEAVFGDNVRDIELVFVNRETRVLDGYNTLVIEQKDKHYPLTVMEYIRVLPEYDLYEKWIEIRNTSKKEKITIENIQSGTFFLPKNVYDLTHLSGQWGAEFQTQTTRLDRRAYGPAWNSTIYCNPISAS